MSANALDYITIKGFKSIASIETLPLKQINVVIGANGSGKSNFLGAFKFLRAISDGRLRTAVAEGGGAERILHFGSKTTKEVELELFFAARGRYEITLFPTSDDSLYPSEEIIHPWSEEGNPSFSVGLGFRKEGREAGISDPKSEGIEKWVGGLLRTWRVYHLNDTSSSSPLLKTARLDDNRFLRPDAANLAPFLYYLHERHEASYRSILHEVRRVAPFFDDFLLEPVRLKPDDIKLEWRHKESDQTFGLSSLSDGTLRFIALATLFLQPEMHRPSMILVDEPELGLHPYAIGMLAALVRQASQTNQVVLSTQSPTLLDHFAPEDVLVADRINGATTLTRQDPDRLAKWL
jgi:predicted ATPase